MVEILTDSVDAFGLGTLASKTALVVQSDHGTALLKSFLMKKFIANLALKTPDAGDVIIVGLARGDATVTEIANALQATQFERDLQTQANRRMVLMESLRIFHGTDTANGGMRALHYEVSVGGGKGIPFEDGDGWQWFVYNPDDGSLAAGSEIMGIVVYFGVWLN